MEALVLQPAALDALEVATTDTAPADPTYHIYQEWCDGTAAVRAELVFFGIRMVVSGRRRDQRERSERR